MGLNLPLLLETGYWFNGNPGPPTPITYGLLGLFVVTLAAGLLVWLRRRQLFPGQRIKTRLAAQLGPWFVGFAGAGLFFLLLRLVEFPILSGRVLWLVCLLGMTGVIGYLAWYGLKRYPDEVARVFREEERLRYMPKRRAKRPARRR